MNIDKRTKSVISKSFITLLILMLTWASQSGCRDKENSPAISGSASISGTVQYEDREYNTSGFTGTSFKNVRFATVEVIDSSRGWVLGSGITDQNGAYSITFSYYSPVVYIRVMTEASFTGGSTITIYSNTGSIFGAGSGNITVSNGELTTANLSLNLANYSNVSGAFNILDVLTSGFEFIYSLTSGSYPPSLAAYWSSTGTVGTYYCMGGCPKGNGIYMLGNYLGDTDGFDDDVIWHEFGHFVANAFSQDESPGGLHSLTYNDLDLRLSWSEGWGNFFPGAIKAWITIHNPSLLSADLSDPQMTLSTYIDTVGNIPGIEFNFGDPPNTAYYKYSSSEVAVAKVLWDLQTSYSMNSVWEIFTSLNLASSPVNLESFWDVWKAQRNASFATEKANLETIYNGLNIYYKIDSYEAAGDDTTTSARIITLPALETHFLFRDDSADDKDIVGFNVTTADITANKSFAINTTSQETLKNGADTILTILDSEGASTGYTNDNYNNGFYNTTNCTVYGYCPINGDIYSSFSSSPAPLSSSLTFVPPTEGIYYVEVKTSPSLPQSAGRYGSYRLSITKN